MKRILSDLVKAVEENVDGQWVDWESAEHICDTYCENINDLETEEVEFLEKQIKENGEFLEIDMHNFGLNGM